MSSKINKSYCQDLLDNDNKKAVKNGIEAIKEQIKENQTEIGKLVNAINEFKDDEFLTERLENTKTIKENWNKSLDFYLPKIILHYMDL